MIDADRITPTQYAKRLAGYVSDPSKIRAYTYREYGRAPSLEKCREFRSMRAPKPMPKHLERPFACGHRPDVDNVIEVHGKETCLQCHSKAQAEKEAKRAKERERQAVNLEERARKIAEARARVVNLAISFSGDVVRDVCGAFNIPENELFGPSRDGYFVAARAVAIKLLRDRGLSTVQIGRRVSRDHSTVSHALQSFDAYMARRPRFKAVYEAMRIESE